MKTAKIGCCQFEDSQYAAHTNSKLVSNWPHYRLGPASIVAESVMNLFIIRCFLKNKELQTIIKKPTGPVAGILHSRQEIKNLNLNVFRKEL